MKLNSENEQLASTSILSPVSGNFSGTKLPANEDIPAKEDMTANEDLSATNLSGAKLNANGEIPLMRKVASQTMRRRHSKVTLDKNWLMVERNRLMRSDVGKQGEISVL